MWCGHNRNRFICLVLWAMLPSWAAAQREGEPPLLSGGFVQQLRSLPAKALETFQLSDSSSQSQAVARPHSFGRTQSTTRPRAGSTQPTSAHPGSTQPSNMNLPAQPTGRATLQRTHQSPWLERFSSKEEAQLATQPRVPPQDPSSVYRPVQGRRTSPLPPQGTSETTPSRPADSYAAGPNSNQSFTLSDRRPVPIRDPQPEDLGQEVVVERELPEDVRMTLPSERNAATGKVWREELSPSAPSASGLPKRYFPSQPSLRPASSGLTGLGAEGVGESSTGTSTSASLAADTLQQAPRVSRIPLPRPASARTQSPQSAVEIDNRPSSTVPPTETAKRVPALPTSASPAPGTMRISNATRQSSLSDLDAQSVRVPAMLEGATELERQSTLAESTDTLAAPAPDRGLDTNLSDSRLTDVPPATLPPPTDVPSDPASLGLSLPTTPLPAMPTLEPTRGGPVLPELPAIAPLTTQPSLAQPKPTQPNLPAMALQPNIGEIVDEPATATTAPSARRTHLPKLVNEGMRTRVVAEPPASPDERLKMEAPHVRVVLNGPADIPLGRPADYAVVVHNDDTIDLQGLILRLDIPAGVQVEGLKPSHGQLESERTEDGLTMLTWGFEHLSAGQTATAPMRLVASSAKNFAVAMEWTLMPIAGTSHTAVSAPRLELALEGPAEVKFAEPNVYRLHIRNPGTAVAKQVRVQLSAEQFGSSSAEIPQVAPGEEEVIDVELTFNQRGSIQIKAEAKEQSGLSSQTAISVLVRQAVVQAEMLAAEAVYHGSPAECRVRLTNTGDADATDLRATVQLPTGASLLSAPTGAALAGRELTWTISKLAAGSSKDFPLQLKLTGEGANVVRFSCTGSGPTNVSAQTTTHVEAITDLKLFVEDPIAPAPVGGEVVYELKLTNRGSKAATNVKVIAQFSEGIEPIRGEGRAARVVPGQALFEPIARIGAGETVHLQVVAQAAASGVHRFRVEVRSDESEVRLVQEQSTQYLDGASRMATPLSGSVLR
jgi:uncharacterized repeat protein (TIGR01451 family)